MELTDSVVFAIGPLAIHKAIVITWGIMAVLGFLAWLASRNLQQHPSRWQTMLEGAVLAMEATIANVEPKHARRILPLIGTFWVYLVVANLIGIVPGLEAPTRNLSVTTALALVVFFSVTYFGIRINGRHYFAHYLKPSPILLPFHLVSEVTRTLALAMRLFGNIMSLEMAALLVLIVAGFLVPIPILMLHIIEALVQAYIFGMLALIYVASAVSQVDE